MKPILSQLINRVFKDITQLLVAIPALQIFLPSKRVFLYDKILVVSQGKRSPIRSRFYLSPRMIAETFSQIRS